MKTDFALGPQKSHRAQRFTDLSSAHESPRSGSPNAVLVSAVYPPEPVVSAQMGRDLARHLTLTGARVTVVCPFPSRPLGVHYEGFGFNGASRMDYEDGVEVVRLPSYRSPQSRLIARMRESWSFGRQVCRYLAGQARDADVIYANVWPLLSQALIARHCAIRRIPLVLHVQDIYPEALLGKLPRRCRGMVAWPLLALDRWIVRRTARVVVISENTRRTYLESRGLAPEGAVTILNWVDPSRFAHPPTREEACSRYGIPEDRFTFLYLGNIGPVAGVEFLIEAFHAAGLKHAQLIIAGDGSSRGACVGLVKRMGLSDVLFVSDPAAGNVPLLQSLAHVCLLPMRKGAGLSSIPSKLMAYLLSAKPVLATVDANSDTARCIQEAQCGWVGEPENVSWLAAKLTEINALPSDVLDSLGQRGRAYGLKTFSKSEGVRRLAGIVEQAARLHVSHKAATRPIEGQVT